MNLVLLAASVFLGAGRSVFSKKIPFASIKTKAFYINQSILFFSAAIGIFLFNLDAFKNVSSITFAYGIVFGLLTFMAQCCYTIALNKGPTAICAMIYAFGFIFPTVSGIIFWNEPFKCSAFLGIVLVISSIVISSVSREKTNNESSGFILPNLIAMASAGGLGIMQKVHQSSEDKENLGGFLIIAFVLATVVSVVSSFLCGNKEKEKKRTSIFPACAGFCFGLISMLNTLLAGKMPGTVLFPTLNIGVMMACLVAGVLIFKEKPTKRQIIAFVLGILAVIVLNVQF